MYFIVSIIYLVGMRLLHEPYATQITDRINKFLLGPENPFEYEEINTRILAGEEEGVFAWITTNYLTGFFNNPGIAEY